MIRKFASAIINLPHNIRRVLLIFLGKMNTYLSVPFVIYIIILCISLSFILIPLFFPKSEPSSIIINIGYGIFCSTIVAGILDCSSVVSRKRYDRIKYLEAFLNIRIQQDMLIDAIIKTFMDKKEFQQSLIDKSFCQILVDKYNNPQIQTEIKTKIDIIFDNIDLYYKKIYDTNGSILYENTYLPLEFINHCIQGYIIYKSAHDSFKKSKEAILKNVIEMMEGLECCNPGYDCHERSFYLDGKTVVPIITEKEHKQFMSDGGFLRTEFMK